MSIDAYFDPAELRENMHPVPAATEQLVRRTVGEVTAELGTGEVPPWYSGSLRTRRLELADTLTTIGLCFDAERGSQPSPFAELADDIRHAA